MEAVPVAVLFPSVLVEESGCVIGYVEEIPVSVVV
jgi:hypothetical protein